MKKEKIFILTIFFLVLLAGVFFYFQRFYYMAATNKINSKEIILGWDQWPGVLPYLVAYEKGFFKERGLNIKLYETANNSIIAEDLVNEKVDFVADLTLEDVIKANDKGHRLQIVAVTDYSTGADGIVVKNNINSIADLKNKTVAVEVGSLSEKLLYYALQRNNLKLSDIKVVNVLTTDSAKVFSQKNIDAVVTYEPFLTQSIKEGAGKSLYSTVLTPGLIIDVLAMKKGFIDKNPETVKAILESYFKALDFISTNKKESYQIGSKYFNKSESEMDEYFKGIRLTNLRDNLSAMSYSAANESLYGSGELTNRYLIDRKIIEEKVNLMEIVRPEFIRQIQAEKL